MILSKPTLTAATLFSCLVSVLGQTSNITAPGKFSSQYVVRSENHFNLFVCIWYRLRPSIQSWSTSLDQTAASETLQPQSFSTQLQQILHSSRYLILDSLISLVRLRLLTLCHRTLLSYSLHMRPPSTSPTQTSFSSRALIFREMSSARSVWRLLNLHWRVAIPQR